MRTFIAFISLSVLLLLQSGCCDTSEDKRDYQLIQGIWVSEDNSTKNHDPARIVIPLGPRQSVFSFQDSLCSVMPFADFSSFSIRNKVIYVWKNNTHYPRKKAIHRRYKIISLKKNQLLLIAMDARKHYSDTLTLGRIKEKNRIIPTMISFHSSGCYGTCPSISLDVDSNRTIRYFGGGFAKKEGGYKGTISDQDYKVLLRLIHQLPLKTLKKDYAANWTDDQTCTIAIRYNGKWKTCRVYGCDQEPIELRLLLQRFFLIDQKTQLSPDSTVNNNNFKAYQVAASWKEKIPFLPPVVSDEP
jgi:hypothetical protein